MTAKVIAAIKRGEVVILPLEHGYVYACDAFSFAAVNRLHQLRNDQPGIAAQVLVGKIQTISGLAQKLGAGGWVHDDRGSSEGELAGRRIHGPKILAQFDAKGATWSIP